MSGAARAKIQSRVKKQAKKTARRAETSQKTNQHKGTTTQETAQSVGHAAAHDLTGLVELPESIAVPGAAVPAAAMPDARTIAAMGLPEGVTFPSVGWEMVTPELAAEWLHDLNIGNRTVKDAHVVRLSHDMAEGKWNPLNGETIAFDRQGRLTDGQHRLIACIRADKPFVALVVRGVPDDSYFTQGIGAKKALADFLSPDRGDGQGGEKNAMLLSAAIRLVFMWVNGTLGLKDGRHYPTIPQMVEVLEQNPALRESVAWAAGHGQVRDLLTSSYVVLIHYAGTLGGHSALVSDFLERLGNGIGLLDNSAIYHLRSFLLSQKSNRRKHGSLHVLALVIKAWNFVLDEKPCKMLVLKPGEAFPVLR